MDNIRSKAEAFSNSYGGAMELSLQPNISREECAKAVASHYSPNFLSFAFGAPAVKLQDISPGATQASVVASHLEKFEKAGFGWRIKLVKYDVQVYSPGSAQCWLTWEIEPKQGSGVEPWQWTNIYAFRLPMNEKGELADEGFWEYSVSDQEIDGLSQRCPKFWEL